MKSLIRIFCTAIVALATFYFVGIWGGAVGGEHFAWVSFPASVACAALAARSVWRRPFAARDGLIRSIVLGAVVTGAIGFTAGFVGPMILTPESNQGPLLGIFITGPLGLVAGAIGGAIRWWWR